MDFTTFNILEGLFWCLLSLVSLNALVLIRRPGKRFWYLVAGNFFLFGLSDFAEVYTQSSFLSPGFGWLLGLKIACVVVFFILLVYYVRERA
jgi:hypothetical protein